MKKYLKHTITFVIVFLLITGCSRNIDKDVDDTIKPADDAKSIDENQNETLSESGNDKLRIWVYYDDWSFIADSFKEKETGTSVIIEVVNETPATKYLEAIAAGNAPDILAIEGIHMGMFNSTSVLENLYDIQYNAGEVLRLYTEVNKDIALSFDGEKLIGLPLTSSPAVTIYRTDIMEEFGFPHEPDELGDYMEDPENWLKMAQTFKEHDKWILQWEHEILNIVGNSKGYFDRDMNFIRNNRDFQIVVDLLRQIRGQGLSAEQSIWSNRGIEAVKEGRFPMLYLGSWGVETVKNWAPETAGKWRVTRLPLGSYGNYGNIVLSITRQSTNKDMAWQLIKDAFVAEKKYNAYIRDKDNDFLGGQKDNLLFFELRKKTPDAFLTPLDFHTEQIWYREIASGVETGYNSRDILNNIENMVYETFEKEISILKESLQ